MTQDLLLYDPKFARANDDGRYQRAQVVRTVTDAFRDVGRAVTQAFDVIRGVVMDAVRWFGDLSRQLAALGLLPPDPAAMLCGQRWRSPIDGTKYRVAGQRGNRHWIEAGPRGYRYKR